ncbi:MAG: DUF72 domain-containing protein [Liquorilactobacillus nagelii]|uniref:DUF72 domain-containing protein n=1 Tax=Liquorilactobacillus nagelii TaxID=82688 RepID=A0A3S6QUA4_9LACO|nr:DUF72 domain-containing protein [Liquorilactobacillus nagelii]AUJ31716.1 hypothetical protein BSQ50_03570 [Liquorilactobacillus nagelii]MCP9314221.1 DUF72 domain-containing protein [Liquorilactobacillus nagelii]
MMITLGLTTWSEHPALINQQRQSVTLAEYAAHFPTVEVDTFFYGIPRPQIITGWQQQVPAKFQFIVKANQALTGHLGETLTGNQLKERFKLFAAILAPLQQAGQLKTILCQFPPFFEATTRNVAYLKFFRQMLPDLPLTLELRHRSWYQGQNATSLIKFCREQRYTLAVVDEPTGLPTSIPLYPAVTTPELMFWRLHGRNQLGWQARGKDWRKQRTLYRYSAMELTDLKQQVEQFTHQVQEICIIFNNNSARDAAPNALQLQKMLGLHFSGLNPKSPEQLGLF